MPSGVLKIPTLLTTTQPTTQSCITNTKHAHVGCQVMHFM
jgi:hypothetical protein